ncbi:MAG: hypothetical protein L0387_24985, partial [Acidobacteria bacterium]|nr:hypothetical protein [Acidobacteriota bacterium]MCI0719334.1 hypothetical protein [Acidobacteriota bacterium]
DTKRSIGGFRKDRSHHPGAGCASARPSSAEEGSQKVQSPISGFGGSCSADLPLFGQVCRG